ncbi:MAG: hypothetical protein ACRC2S_23525 [Waterburya sp.]
MKKKSLPSKTQHSSTESKKSTNSLVSLARQRAIEVRQKANLGNSSSGYEFGGWKSILENYVESPKYSPKTSSLNDSAKSNSEQTNVIKKPKKATEITLCPSSQADTDDAVVFGVVEGTIESPRITYLDKFQPFTEEIQDLTTPVKPTEMMRIASSCQEKKCLHFDGSDCRLAQRIVQQLPSVTENLPACQIRSDCRWWQQEGKSACLRCPQVVTKNYYTSPLFERVAEPKTS